MKILDFFLITCKTHIQQKKLGIYYSGIIIWHDAFCTAVIVPCMIPCKYKINQSINFVQQFQMLIPSQTKPSFWLVYTTTLSHVYTNTVEALIPWAQRSSVASSVNIGCNESLKSFSWFEFLWGLLSVMRIMGEFPLSFWFLNLKHIHLSSHDEFNFSLNSKKISFFFFCSNMWSRH